MNIISLIMLIMFGGTCLILLSVITYDKKRGVYTEGNTNYKKDNFKIAYLCIGFLAILSTILLMKFTNGKLIYEVKQWNGKLEKIQVARINEASEKDYYNIVDSKGNKYYCKMNVDDINSEKLQIGLANIKSSNKYHIYKNESNVGFAIAIK